MADAIVRLKVESQEYEGKIKRAVQGLQQLEKHVRDMGATFEVAEKADLEFVRALGDMETQTQSVKGKMREFQEAILSLQQQYDNLTDAEKSAPFGKAMSDSIDKLKVRAAELKDNMSDLNQELKNMASDTIVFDQIAGGVGFMVSAFQVGQGALQMFGVENKNAVEAMAKLQGAIAVTNGLVQIQNALQKQSALMLGVTNLQRKAAAAAAAIEAAAVGKGTVALKAAAVAQKALNAVAKANPYVLLASAIAAVGVALWEMGKSSEEANEAMEKAEDSIKNYNDTMGQSVGSIIASYKILKAEWETLSTDAEKTAWIDKQKGAFDQLGISVRNVADAENIFVNNTEKMIKALTLRAQALALEQLASKEYELYFQGLLEQGGMVKAGDQVGMVSAIALNRYDQSLREDWAQKPNEPANYRYVYKNSEGNWEYSEWGAEQENLRRAERAGVSLGTGETYISMLSDIKKESERLLNELGVAPLPTTISGGGTKSAEELWREHKAKIEELEKLLGEYEAMANNMNLDSYQQDWAKRMVDETKEQLDRLKGITKESFESAAEELWREHIAKIEELEKLLGEYEVMANNMNLGTDQQDWARRMVEETKEQLDRLKGITKESFESAAEEADNVNMVGPIRTAFQKAQDSIRIKLADKMQQVDENAFTNLLTVAVQHGIDSLNPNFENLQYQMGEGLDIPDSAWEELVADINEQLEAMELDPIKLDVTTGSVSKIEKEAKSSADAWQSAAKAVSNLGSALQNIEDPSAQVAGIIMQAVANIALGFAQATASKATGAAGVFGWIAAATAGLATMTATIASIKSVTKGYADGGMVGGNSYSGDNIVARLNSGEGVLTANGVRNAQTMAANANTWGNLQLEALISGESLRLVLANNASRRGGSREQYAISKFG